MRSVSARWWWGWATACALVAGALLWLCLSAAEPETPRARAYRDVTVCLLTDGHGVAGEQAATVWAGMQEASVQTLARVQFLPVAGPQTLENAATHVASLAHSGCRLVLAVGDVPVRAVAQSATTFPEQRFVLVGGAGAAGDNVSLLAVDRAAVRAAVVAAVS